MYDRLVQRETRLPNHTISRATNEIPQDMVRDLIPIRSISLGDCSGRKGKEEGKKVAETLGIDTLGSDKQ